MRNLWAGVARGQERRLGFLVRCWGRGWRGVCWLGAAGLLSAAGPVAKVEPPRITLVQPWTLVPGTTNVLKVRGLNFTNLVAVRFPGAKAALTAQFKAPVKADVPKDFDPQRWGDSLVDVELRVPLDAVPGRQPLLLVTSAGESAPYELTFADSGTVLVEQEPNEGFRTAQSVVLGKAIQGSIQAPGDVDVYRFEARAGDEITAEVWAARRGSALDSILTLYDARGQILIANDDSGGVADAALRFKLPHAGVYYLGLIDAFDRGGPLYSYELVVRRVP